MYIADQVTSFFDNPERSREEGIITDQEILSKHRLVTKLLDGFPNAAMILNQNRQIVAYNKNALNLVVPDNIKSIYGQRIGEAIGCIHAFEMPAGCGTSKFCSECGAGQCNKHTRETLLDARQECRVIVKKNNVESSLDLRIGTSIIKLDDNNYLLFSIENIQDEKRRKVLERIFFHDILNTAASVQGLTEIISTTDSIDEINEFKLLLHNSADQLVKELLYQRDLILAEEGTLSVNTTEVSANEILRSAYEIYKNHRLANGKNYTCQLSKEDKTIKTDKVLLVRSLSNLLKNALEASNEGGTVNIFLSYNSNSFKFQVFNDKVIPESVQLQIFQRSFSTKAKSGRGVGTYSVKLLVENYLGGKVTFISNPELQTIFSIELSNPQ